MLGVLPHIPKVLSILHTAAESEHLDTKKKDTKQICVCIKIAGGFEREVALTARSEKPLWKG